MKPEIWISIYAAILATTALALNIKTWFDSGVKLKLSVIPDGVVMGGDPQFDEKDLVILNVINRGRTPTMVSNLLLFEYQNKWRLWRNRPTKIYVIPNPQFKGYPSNVPVNLEPSQKWTGALRMRPDLKVNPHDGKHYIGITTTNRDRQYMILIPPKPVLPLKPTPLE